MLATWVRWLVRDERGSVLVGGLMLVLVMTLVGSGVFYAAVLDNRAALNDGQQTQALYIAQAGLNAAVRELTDNDREKDVDQLSTSNNTTFFTNPNRNRPLGDGSFTVTAIPTSNPSGFMVRSTACVPANCPTGHTEVTVQRSITGQQQNDLLGGSFFLFDNTFSTGGPADSYNSSQGTYNTTKCPQDSTICAQNPASCICGQLQVHTNGTGAASSTTPTLTLGNAMYGSITDSRGQINVSGGTVYGNVTWDSSNATCTNSSGCNTTHVKGTCEGTSCPPSPLPPTTASPTVMKQISPCNNNGGYTSLNILKSHILRNGIAWDGVNIGSGKSCTLCYNTPNAGDFTVATDITLKAMTTSDDPNRTPPGYCFNSFTVSGSPKVNPNDPTTDTIIYVTGAVSLAGSAIINLPSPPTTPVAKRFQIRSSYDTKSSVHIDFGSNTFCSDSANKAVPCGVAIAGGASWYIYVYAPFTQISAQGNAELWGALLGYDFMSGNNVKLHIDVPLSNGGTLSYTWGTWQACKNPSCT